MHSTYLPPIFAETMTPGTWDSMPRCFFTKELCKTIELNRNWIYKHEYSNWNNEKCSVSISPASIINPEGGHVDVYPGVNEELVEEVLKNAAQYSTEPSAMVSLSADEIRRELARHGHWLHVSEVETAISILQMTGFDYVGPRSELKCRTIASSQSLDVNELSDTYGLLGAPILFELDFDRYNNTNYKNILSLFLPLSRWIYRMVASQYFAVSKENEHSIKMSSLIDSGLLLDLDEKEVGSEVDDAFDELRKIGIITSSVVEITTGDSEDLSDRCYEFKAQSFD